MKRCATSLRNYKSKQKDTTTRLLWWWKSKTLTTPNVGEDDEQQELLFIAGGTSAGFCFFKKKTTHTLPIGSSNRAPRPLIIIIMDTTASPLEAPREQFSLSKGWGLKCTFQSVCPDNLGKAPHWAFSQEARLLCPCGRCESWGLAGRLGPWSCVVWWVMVMAVVF